MFQKNNMNKINLKFDNKIESYDIFFDEDFKTLKKILKDKERKVFVLTDENVKTYVLDKFKININPENLFILKPGEDQKKLENIEKIWSWLVSRKADRSSILINVGGGVVTDMGGFVASCFMRGVDFVQVPTTLLAQVDASVGGKTGVDFETKKNLIGAFSQPQSVIISTKVLKSLKERDFKSGFAEIIKHALIADKNYLDLIEKYFSSTSSNQEKFKLLEEIIKKSCQIKAEIVQKDEKESGLRKILNFGHTVGHAIESYGLSTSYPHTHGESVALGMLCEGWISYKKSFITKTEFETIFNLIKKAGLPTKIPLKKEKVLELMVWDKKNQNNKIKWVLLKKLGEAGFDFEADPKIVKDSLSILKD